MNPEENERKQYRDREEDLKDEGLIGSKKFKVDYVERQNRPIVMQGNTLYIFIEGCKKEIMKVVRDICDPISKPQKVHEYKVTQASLLRAQALGYTKNSIIEFLNENVRNKMGVTDFTRQMVNRQMGSQ